MKNNMIIRQVKSEDVKSLVDIYSYYVRKYPYSFEYEPPSLDDFTKRIENITGKFPFFVCESEGEIIGYTYAHKYKEREAYQWICESSIYVKNGCGKIGVGTLLYKNLLLALEKQGFVKVFAVLGCPNKPSERFHEKMGFTLQATFPQMGYKFDKWHDIKYYVKQLNPINENLKKPMLFSQIDFEIS